MKGATSGTRTSYDGFGNFNPRTREGCDVDVRRRLALREEISIHAPVKGATDALFRRDDDVPISIHAPVKGATREPITSTPGSLNFNPRTREGCDLVPHVVNHTLRLFQSTHP